MEIGCKANLKACKKNGSDFVLVTVTYHTKHTRNSNYTWTRQRLFPLIKEWQEKITTCGNDWNACKELLRPDEKSLDVPESTNYLKYNSLIEE